MTGADWALLVAMPATILAAAAVAVFIIRWQATNTVFWVLKNHSARWAELAKDVKEFEPLFRGAETAHRLEIENKMLHAMITEKLAPIATIAHEMGDLKTAVTLLKDQIGRFATAVEDMPERMAVMEERQRNHIDEKERQQRTGPPDRRRRE